jgi:Ca2+-binding RTX toxin-like protein
MRARSRAVLFLAGLLVASVLQGLPPASAAEIWIVDDPGPDCLAGVDFDTIQEAVNDPNVDPGDIVKVCPGVYQETVTVTKQLRFLGPQAGVDARTRPGGDTTEAIVGRSGGAFDVRVGGVVIDGFKIRGGTDPGWGVRFDPGGSGYRLANNIVEENMFGVNLNSDGGTQTLIERNLFRNNNWTGPPADEPFKAGEGIYSDQGLSNAVIDSNRFSGHADDAIFLNGGTVDGTASHFDVTISNNSLLSDNSIALVNTTSSLIIGNEHVDSQGSAVFIGGGVTGLDIVGNVMRDGKGRGIRIVEDGFCPGEPCTDPAPNADIRVFDNEFVGNASRAIDVAAGRYAGILDARYNWWGDASGPSGWGNGAGQAVSAHVQFFPWALDLDFERLAACRNRSTKRSDIVDGTLGNDILCGGGGDDIIRGRGGNDLLIGGSGDDLLKGARGNDALIGGAGYDLLIGGAGFDSLQGWQDDDLCLTGADGGQTATCEG